MIARGDEAESDRAEAGHTAGEWTDLGAAAGTKMLGLSRIKVDPGKTEAGLPRAGVSWLGGTWVEAGGGDHPWQREAAAGRAKRW